MLSSELREQVELELSRKGYDVNVIENHFEEAEPDQWTIDLAQKIEKEKGGDWSENVAEAIILFEQGAQTHL